LDSIPAGTIEQQLRAALKAGMSAEDATRHVLGPFGAVLAAAGNDALVGSARPSVLASARRMARQMTRRAEDRAFGAAPGTDDRMRLGRLEFHLPNGDVVAWADATSEQHETRILWLDTYIGSLETDRRRHERAVKLLENSGGGKLADIEGWESLIGDDTEDDDGGDASIEVVP
jgi:hypothetical protein